MLFRSGKLAAEATPAALKLSLKFDNQEKADNLVFPTETGRKTTLKLVLGAVQLELIVNRWAEEWALDRALIRLDVPERAKRVNSPLP